MFLVDGRKLADGWNGNSIQKGLEEDLLLDLESKNVYSCIAIEEAQLFPGTQVKRCVACALVRARPPSGFTLCITLHTIGLFRPNLHL